MEEQSIIRNDRISRHNVESYHFKVLGTNLTQRDEIVEDGIDEFIKEDETPRKKIKEAPSLNPQKESINTPDDSFIEKLLKKTDELSSENIKLQMQNESQKADFDRELALQLQTTKDESLSEGYQKAKDEMEGILKSLQEQYMRSCNLLDQKLKDLEEFIKKTELELSDTAIEIAQEVIKKEINENSSQVALSLSRSLLKELQGATKIEIRVNPKDFPTLNESLKDEQNLKITNDEAIVQGGVIILSDSGNLDGSIKTRMDKIIQLTKE